MDMTRPKTRIQLKNRTAILEAALIVFSAHGFRGATLDQIAKEASLSKPNLLYYFPSKEAIHTELLSGLMDTWLDPLRQLDEARDPVEEIVNYVLRKLEMSRELPRESRLFANEIVQGAPRMRGQIEGLLTDLVNEKSRVIQGWIDAGKLAPVDPRHLLFSIWANTQHYADFEAQVRGILRPEANEHYDDASEFLQTLYRRMLTPG